MRIEVVPSLAEPVGALWKKLQVQEKGHFFVSSPLSASPLPIYQWVVKYADAFTGWDRFRFVLMDEMVDRSKPPFTYIPITDAASYEGFAQKHFLYPLQKKTGITIKVLKPHPQYLETYSKPIDLLILALGVHGNYANVMPGTKENTGWHVAHLTSEFRETHTDSTSQSYPGVHFREYGMSLGPKQVLSSKNVVVIASGEKKHHMAKQLLSYDSFDPDFPLSIVCHPKVSEKTTIFITDDVGIDGVH